MDQQQTVGKIFGLFFFFFHQTVFLQCLHSWTFSPTPLMCCHISSAGCADSLDVLVIHRYRTCVKVHTRTHGAVRSDTEIPQSFGRQCFGPTLEGRLLCCNLWPFFRLVKCFKWGWLCSTCSILLQITSNIHYSSCQKQLFKCKNSAEVSFSMARLH